MIIPSNLRILYHEGRLLPFIGAGISMSLEWEVNGVKKSGPSWRELVNKAANLAGFSEPDLLRVRGTDLQILEYFKQENDNSLTVLTNWLVKEFQPTEDAFKNSSIHKGLCSLKECKLFYTTNFDTFLEDSFKVLGRNSKVIAKESDMCKSKNGECEIIKFHGDLLNPDKMVLTEADYEKRLALSTEMDYRFKSDLLNRTVLFLGYSFRDPNVSYLFRTSTEHIFNKNGLREPKAYIVVKNPSRFEKSLFNSRHIEVIPANTEDLTSFISELLENIKN